MTRTIALIRPTRVWRAPAYWLGASPTAHHKPALHDRPTFRAGFLSRIVEALLAADRRYRDGRAMDRMSDRTRRDIGLPPRGQETRRLHSQMLEWQRWY